MKLKHVSVLALSAVLVCLMAPDLAHAAATGMPWEGPLDKTLKSVTGPVAGGIAAIVIVMSGLGLTFGEGSGGTRKIMWVGMGLSVTFSAVSLMSALFGFSQGAAF